MEKGNSGSGLQLQHVCVWGLNLRVSWFSCRGASEGSAGADRLQEAAGAGVPRSERHFAISCLPYVVFLSFSHHFSVSVWPKLPIFFPCSDNFQDQMKRELAYREEMVQQLQMVRGNMDSLKRFCCY
ncbi:unnamed protein product [Tetraodon nigroviridis]|uniref:(spotted green pufferfish) hypothetical protein n=1 Tax=Tetraodon nigroviridis TaxID=99883 RepID=Q4T2P8_TETNG|nr:unnamed protein product [Tetraodon nigroviridis]